jgi:tRNA pseudouridine55 synthase
MFNFSEGEILLIDKELNWTSFDVVNFLKPAIWSYEEKKTGVRNKIKIGHAGTLDPLATGLLIVCTGKKTKEINTIQQLPKTYTGTFYIGATTPSFDRELKVDKEYPTSHITKELILSTAKSMIGPQLQTPPIYSAVSINGVRAYQLARNNVEVVLSPKPIEIYSFEIKNINFPLVDFEVECSKGTYIRAIARDFGIKLNSGAYLHSLRRTKIGNYSVDNALPVKKFLDMLKKLEN